MTVKAAVQDLVQFNSTNLNKFKRSVVKNVVCEFRFPTLMELGEGKAPAKFVNAIRKAYPTMELGQDVSIGLGGPGETTYAHIFRSLRGGWAVSLKHSSLTVENGSYEGYDKLRSRALEAVEAASAVIDSDFFTRVGLRYVNVFDHPSDLVGDEWINPALVQPILSGMFRGIADYSGRMALVSEDGGCLLQHGLQMKPPVEGATTYPNYAIDIDTYRSEVMLADVGKALDAMHKQAFDVFDWSLGSAARKFLSE